MAHSQFCCQQGHSMMQRRGELHHKRGGSDGGFSGSACVLRCPQGEDKKRVSTADLVLVGHEENAQFALGCSSARPLVASGGEDQQARARAHPDFTSAGHSQ